eukprot:1133020-Pyramimonas_sp.AAC.1
MVWASGGPLLGLRAIQKRLGRNSRSPGRGPDFLGEHGVHAGRKFRRGSGSVGSEIRFRAFWNALRALR